MLEVNVDLQLEHEIKLPPHLVAALLNGHETNFYQDVPVYLLHLQLIRIAVML